MAQGKRKPRRTSYNKEKKDLKTMGVFTARIQLLLRLIRLLFFIIVAGFIVFQYYLVTEKKFISYYVTIWKTHKDILIPFSLLAGYTFVIFYVGYRTGKGR